MCKRYTAEIMWTNRGELGFFRLRICFIIFILDNLEDLRVHSEMYPTNPPNIYKACLAGIRRQKF